MKKMVNFNKHPKEMLNSILNKIHNKNFVKIVDQVTL